MGKKATYVASVRQSYLQLGITDILLIWAIGMYVDIQNITFSKISQPLTYLSTDVIINPEAPLPKQKYGLETLELKSGTIIPAIGVTVEF